MLRLVVLVVALAAGTGAAQPRYTVTVIGSASQRPGAGPVSAPLAVNRDGRVVGYAGAPGGLIEAMDWRGGVFSSPCGAGAFVQTSAMAVNNSGLMVGSGWLAGHQTRAVAWSGGLVWDLGGLGGQQAQALGVNDRWEIVGYASLPGEQSVRAFVHRAGLMLALSVPAGATESYAYDISNTGLIAGAIVAGSPAKPYLWRHGVVEPLPIPPTARSGAANAVNDAGLAVGTYESNTAVGAFMASAWQGGVRVDLGTLGGQPSYSVAMDVNGAGLIVGNSISGAGMTGFLWIGGQMHDLRSLVPAGSPAITGARSINDRGQIAGTALVSGRTVAVLLSPRVPQAQ